MKPFEGFGRDGYFLPGLSLPDFFLSESGGIKIGGTISGGDFETGGVAGAAVGAGAGFEAGKVLPLKESEPVEEDLPPPPEDPPPPLRLAMTACRDIMNIHGLFFYALVVFVRSFCKNEGLMRWKEEQWKISGV